ncbi:uncharacterized protein LOC108909240 isoform X3 [Anoplophora glabripennis]|uniref:uncharacterized protein LOC108909240 isoform X3 n=1 Tax=Anoplophora glabripennis TaxID=217634 RepID=UPI0008737CD9|nr:uncharacterized protein LOC108909240 isoform X3 [Anoplophora glabripennis]
MENKKGAFQNQNTTNSAPPVEIPNNESIPKHAHQHNNAPQHLRFLQYGLKIPNHQHTQLTPSHTHQQLNSSLHMHVHQHNPQYQTTHRHLQPSPQFNSMNIQQNPQFPQQTLKYMHQHQKPSNIHQNQPLYQATQPPPSSVHAHNQMAQNTPQIWVPHQPPLIHYHQQQTQKAEAQKPHTPTSSQTQSKPKEVPERKKSSGGSSHLRSPSAKRPLEAPVTMQGWLHKQGSEGLMLWKKRWFVLSEYCLFYYKGLEEEKLLGSILLPSYKVSICRPEDKVNRKYAFKCEHANMRTYILAADSQELMMQWVRVLNLACMLQTNTENEKPAVIDTPTQTKPVENPEPQKQNLRSTPIHTHSSSSTTDLSNPSQIERNQFNQPLYANAPPKPRRLNDGFSSPSPDVLDRYPNPQYIETIHNRSLAKSPISIYSQQIVNPQMAQPEYYSHNRPKDNSREYMFTPTGEPHNTIPNTERRTPDTYGRSKLHPTKFRHPTDYEDIYNDQSMYKRPLSPIAYTHVVKKNNPPLNPAYRAYTPVNMLGPADVVQYAPPQMRKSPSCIARPHSADFLEYEISHRQPNAAVLTRQQPRPKSSLDINRNLNDSDNYFYSEERYAEKMRKSAQYLHKMPPRFTGPAEPSHQKVLPVMRYPENDNTFPLMRSNTQPINFSTLHIREPPPDPQPVRSRSVLSEGSLSKEIDMDFCGSSRNITERGSVSPGYSMRDMYNYNNNIKNREYDQFTRSASARLAQTTPQNERPQDRRHMTREGERKREESMRRLLEWKQRMLQSPLNRKTQGNRAYSSRCDNYHINPENGYPVHNHLKHGEPHLDDRRSITNMPQYNSYSSDDEENEERSKESVHSQAGRTLDTFPNNSESPTPAHTTSTTVFNTFKEPDKPLMHSDFMHDTPYTNIFQLPEDEPCKDSEDSTFTKPLKQFNKESSNLAHVSSLKSEYFDKFEQSPIITEIKSNGALVKSILAEFETKTEEANEDTTEEKSDDAIDIDSVIEENYMTMTPKKSVLGPRSSTNSDATVIFNDLETDENHYVEMTQNADASLLGSTLANNDLIEQQPYEMVCFNEGRLEPVYMELKTPDQKTDKDCKGLPDILMASKSKKAGASKSDSSDADDEASKDLNSLDTPNQPRFSLSDTFRPASYYLGISRTAPEFQDSSDSELVSPPPIPSSPPPLDDLENIQDFNFTVQDKSKKDESYRYNLLARLQVNRNSDQFFNSANKNSKCATKFGKGSTQSLDVKKESFFSNNKSDVSSVCSANIDTELRYDSRLSHNSDSDVEIRIARLVDYENMLKRRPVSEEFCNELESLDGTFSNDNLNDLLVSNTSLASNEESVSHIEYHDYENFFISSYPKGKSVIPVAKTPRPAMASPVISQSAIKETNDIQANAEFLQIGRSESSASTSAEISSLLHNSNCSTPVVEQDVMSTSSLYMSDRRDKSANSSFSQSAAPYYYSDLSVNTTNTESGSMLTLNNQRGAMNGSKRDITRIMNPIKCNSHIRNSSNASIECDMEKDTFKLAAEARSVSVDFLNLTDKSGSIDKKNIYESDTLKRQKISDLATPETRNLYPMRKNDKFNTEDDTSVRRSHSLEGLLENVLSETIDNDVVAESESENIERHQVTSEGSYLWEEDSIWRERLRSASQRHTKSMEDLDSIGEVKKKQKKSSRGISRDVTYVNDNFFKQDKHQKEQENKETKSSKNEIKKEGSFIIDREKLRQWDLLSSAPSDDQLSTTTAVQVQEGNNLVVELGEGNCDPTENSNTQEAASGSISINPRDVSQLNMRDTFPRSMSTKKVWPSNQPPMESKSVTNLSRNNEIEQFGPSNPQNYYPGQHDIPPEVTHQITSRKAQLHMMDQARRMENLQKLEQIKQHLLELEKQYEKGKPLVNLVDNMVKLGSLYRVPTDRTNLTPYIRDRLEFNQQIQERRLLAEEKREWNRLNPNHFHLQEKVQQLYQLDRLIHEESGTLQNLQQDKEDIERALGGLRHRLSKGFNDPAEIEQARKQQIMLENELSRVHLMLAQNSKKLEETVAGNARLEQELLVLKQKLQTSRQQRSSQQFSNAGDSLTCAVGNSAMLESDLQRVQKKIGDLQKQRQELSIQVRQLTDRSNNIPQQKSSPSSVQSSQCKKKITSLWRETDLDTMNIVDHGELWDNSISTNPSTPLYINTDMKLGDSDFYNRSTRSSDSTSDNTSLNSNIPQEKQEIKTVRIVKRESERRQRDREKTTTGKWDTVMEEDDSSQNSSILFRPTPVQKIQSATNLASPSYEEPKTDLLSRQNSISSPNLPQCSDGRTTSSTDVSTDKSPELSPIFKSEAARQIITEMSIQDTPKHNNRRAIPKEKRRHYTAPHNNLIMKSLHQLPTDSNAFNKMIMNSRRARDDMDMERALRQRIDAPDVVRSTLSNKELKYNENTIDNILGTPNKISIPERYIPEQLPQLSAEEQEYRLRKVESIKKMLSDTALISSSSANLNSTEDKQADNTANSITNKATTKMIEEKKQREHLLHLNQILAKQVMEMSKIVAVKALAKLPLQLHQVSTEEEDSSPLTPLPIYQQRDNFYS